MRSHALRTSYFSIAVIKKHNHGNLQEKELTGVEVMPSWWGTWEQAGRRGAGAVGESFYLTHKQEAESKLGMPWLLTPQSLPRPVTHLLQQFPQGHTF